MKSGRIRNVMRVQSDPIAQGGKDMAIVTISGSMGSGAQEIGTQVAKLLNYEFVDRLILAEAANKIGTTPEILEEKTEKAPTIGDRVASFMRTVVARSALVSDNSDPFYSSGADALLIAEYRDVSEVGMGGINDQISDASLIEVTQRVIMEIANSGDVVIIGRGSNFVLEDWSKSLHVNLTAPLEFRSSMIMDRLKYDEPTARKYITDSDKGREYYHRRFFERNAHDPLGYHITLNVGRLGIREAIGHIVRTVGTLHE